jgi:hypothetical protein
MRDKTMVVLGSGSYHAADHPLIQREVTQSVWMKQPERVILGWRGGVEEAVIRTLKVLRRRVGMRTPELYILAPPGAVYSHLLVGLVDGVMDTDGGVEREGGMYQLFAEDAVRMAGSGLVFMGGAMGEPWEHAERYLALARASMTPVGTFRLRPKHR